MLNEEQTAPLVELRLDEDNSLLFEVTIEGEANSNPAFRFVCDVGDVSYSFRGEPAQGGVEVKVPAMEHRLKPGTYDSHLEVVIENKLFVPLQLRSKFEVATRVVAESVRVENRAPVTVTVSSARLMKKVDEAVKPVKTEPMQVVKPEVVKEAKKQITLRELYRSKKSRG